MRKKKKTKLNQRALVEFELLYKLLAVALCGPLLWGAVHLAMLASGISYVTIENAAALLLNPCTAFCLVLVLFLLALYAFGDACAVILAQNAARCGQKLDVFALFAQTAGCVKRVLRKRNLLLLLLLLLLLPFLNMNMASSVLTTVSIPDVVTQTITRSAPLYLAFVVLLALLAVLLGRELFTLHFFVLEGCDLREAKQKSRQLVRGHRAGALLRLAGLQGLLFAVYLLATAVGVAVFYLLSRVPLLHRVMLAAGGAALELSLLAVMLGSTPLCVALLCRLFYRYGAQAEAVPFERKNRSHKLLVCKNVLICVLAAVALVYVYFSSSGNMRLDIEYVRPVEITAHRGASALYPENTMAAFQGAAEMGADWIELDVQQSGDGVVFVMHDTSFARTTGVKKSAWELTWAEIAQLDAGSFFSSEFAGEQIPSLSEVLAYAHENGLKLNIELKPTGHETDFEKSVVDLIRQYDMGESCVVTSQVYSVLEKVKAYDDEITTVYVMALAYGNVTRLTAADDFSVQASSVTEKLVTLVHNAGGHVYAWTVNSKDAMNRLLDLYVDNLITDDVALAQECAYISRASTMLGEYIKFLETRFVWLRQALALWK